MLMRRSFSRICGCGLLLLPMVVALKAQPARPNVLVVMPDDMSFNDFSFFNAQGPRTPHIDALARESVRLTDFHVSPTCSPTRSALMTGRYNDATGVWHTILGRYFLRPDEITMADVFKANGYRTALFGKWHLGDSYPLRPKDRGFEHVVMFRGGGVDQQHDFWGNRNNVPAMIYVNDRLVALADEDDGIPGAFATTFFTSRAIEYMKERRAQAEPFFLYLPYNVAHAPQDMPPDARPGIDAHEATVENLDKNVGRLLAFLDDSGLAANTLLVFFTDNGMANSLLRGGKGSNYEGGHRVPCFIRWPKGGLAGTAATSREMPRLASHIDLLPTLMDILSLQDVAHRPAPVPLHGKSIRTLLGASAAHEDAGLRDRTVTVDNQRMDELAKYRQGCVMRDDFDDRGQLVHKWRLISSESQAWELYDVRGDIKERKNLVAQPELSGVVAELKSAYETWWREISVRASEYVRPMIGAAAEPVTCLYSHDWHSEDNVPWNQTMIAEGMNSNGFNAVEFARAGVYTFDLRRWPREIAAETTVTSALHTPILDAKSNRPITGKALPIRSARIRVWHDGRTYADEKRTVAPDTDGVVFTLRALPAGPAFVQTWYYDAAEKEICGAYYVYVNAGETVTEAGRFPQPPRAEGAALPSVTPHPAFRITVAAFPRAADHL